MAGGPKRGGTRRRSSAREGECLRGANLARQSLEGAFLDHADLREAWLTGADLEGANLAGADLEDAELAGANLRGADLRGSDLRRADLSGADLRGANLDAANLAEADLRGVRCDHRTRWPSHFQIHLQAGLVFIGARSRRPQLQRLRDTVLFWSTTLAGLALDQATNAYAAASFSGEPMEAVPGLLHLVHERNTGLLFSLLSRSETGVLVLETLLIAGILAHWLFGTLRGYRAALAHTLGTALLLGGGLGNWLDRLRHGAVIDFLPIASASTSVQ